MRLEALIHSQLEPDPDNVRSHIRSGAILELAESIAEYGMLENLVVKQSGREGFYYIVAGERRFRAVGELIKEGRLTQDTKIYALVVDGDGTFENIVENLCREDVSIWDLGFKFNTLVEAGYTQTEIGVRCGKKQGFVSRASMISKGLHPSSIDTLNNLRTKIPDTVLTRIASLKDGDGKPDKEAQKNLIDVEAGIRNKRKRKVPKKTDIQRMRRRVIYMQREMSIPSHAQPYVDAVLNYITGSNKIQFPEEL
jgi:ParB/RepB/Spo0J family partition protein